MSGLDNLGMLFAFALGFLLVNYDNSFIIVKAIDLKNPKLIPTLTVAQI